MKMKKKTWKFKMTWDSSEEKKRVRKAIGKKTRRVREERKEKWERIGIFLGIQKSEVWIAAPIFYSTYQRLIEWSKKNKSPILMRNKDNFMFGYLLRIGFKANSTVNPEIVDSPTTIHPQIILWIDHFNPILKTIVLWWLVPIPWWFPTW